MDSLSSSNVLDIRDASLTNTESIDNENIFSVSDFQEYFPTKCVYCMVGSAEQQDIKLYLDRQKSRLHRFNLHNYLLKIKFAKQKAKEINQNKQLMELESELKKIGEEIDEMEIKLNEKNGVAGISNDRITSRSSSSEPSTTTQSYVKNKLLHLQMTTRPSVPVATDVPVTGNINHSLNIAHRLHLLVKAAQNEAIGTSINRNSK